MIPVQIVECSVSSDAELDLGRAPGSSLRGALYAALRTMYDTNRSITADSEIETNPVAWLLRLEDDTLTGGSAVPRPLSIRPPLASRGQELTFSLAFYGKAISTIPLVLSAIPTMGQIGIGRGRQQFRLRSIAHLDPLTGQRTCLLDERGKSLADMPEAIQVNMYTHFAQLLCQEAIDIEFLTPTRIIRNKRLSHQPMFKVWFQRLLERIRTISKVYMQDPVWVPFSDLLHHAEKIDLVNDQTRWYEAWSGSYRDNMMKPLGGFVGKVQYRGELAPLLPYLLLGQTLQVGKNTIKGCGWYRIQYHWAT